MKQGGFLESPRREMHSPSSVILPITRYKPSLRAPLFIFVDLQKEFLLKGRPLQIEGSSSALENCRTLLQLARDNRFPIAHVRLSSKMVSFHERADGSNWIDEFRPYGSEMIFERHSPSCYSCSEFSRMMDDGGGRAAILAGLGGSTSCLATLIDAERMKHQVTYAFDASSSFARNFEMEEAIHNSAVQLAAQFVDVVSASDIVSQLVAN